MRLASPRRWTPAVRLALAATLAALGGGLSACRSNEPAMSEAIPGLPIYQGAVRDAVQPTPGAGARVERWRIRVPGGDEPARVAEARGDVLTWYRTALEGAGYVLRSDAEEPLQLYTSGAGCTAYVSIIQDAAAPGTLVVELGSATADGACATATAPTE